MIAFASTGSGLADTALDLREIVLEYLSGESSLEEFQESFALSLQTYLDSGDPYLIRLANEVNALLIDDDAEEPMTETEFRTSLYRALSPNGESLVLNRCDTNNPNLQIDLFSVSHAAPTIIETVDLAGAHTER